MTIPDFNPGRTPVDAAAVPAVAPHAQAGSHPARGLAAMLLAAIVAALLVAADSVVDSYADGHLLAGWIVLWAVGFASLALFAGAARGAGTALSSTLSGALHGWVGQRAQRKSDADLLFAAQGDPRIMADIQAAVGHAASMGEAQQPQAPRTTGAVGSMRAAITRRLQSNADFALWQTAQRDPRIMAEVQAAMHRAAVANASMDQALGRAWLARHPVGTFNAAYTGPGRVMRATPMPGLPTHLQYLPG